MLVLTCRTYHCISPSVSLRLFLAVYFSPQVMGPNAGVPDNYTVAGLPMGDLVKFWGAPFESEDPAKGGCKALPIPPRDQW